MVPVAETVFFIPAPHRVRDKLQRESSFFTLNPCSFDFAQDRFRRGDIVGFCFPQQILICATRLRSPTLQNFSDVTLSPVKLMLRNTTSQRDTISDFAASGFLSLSYKSKSVGGEGQGLVTHSTLSTQPQSSPKLVTSSFMYRHSKTCEPGVLIVYVFCGQFTEPLIWSSSTPSI
jgi:hypothetical protein